MTAGRTYAPEYPVYVPGRQSVRCRVFVRRSDGRVMHIKIKMEMNGVRPAGEPVQDGFQGPGPTGRGRTYQMNA